MKHKLGTKSLLKLQLVHADLYKVIVRANIICNERYGIDFGVGETSRTTKRQELMVSTGASTTMSSRHIIRPKETKCHAADLYPYVNGMSTDDFRHFQTIARAMFQAGIEFGIQVEWGGLWPNLKDGPHFQLSWGVYK